MKIGLLGGSFNPVHLGHLVIAQDALEQFELDQVWFLPCAVPAHKSNQQMAGPEQRRAMLERAIGDDLRFNVSTIEIERGGISYTYDTLLALRQRHPSEEFHFIIGADTLFELHTWKKIEKILELCEFNVLGRPGFSEGPIDPQNLKLPLASAHRILAGIATVHLIGIAATEIRRRIAEGLSIRFLVPREVEIYITEHQLYST